jgi:hypothetical protein
VLSGIIAQYPQVAPVQSSTSARRERSLENAGAPWAQNSPFGNSAVRLGRARPDPFDIVSSLRRTS